MGTLAQRKEVVQMIDRWKKRRRQRRFEKAYLILRKESDQHKKAGHVMHFEATGVERLHMACPGCPEHFPIVKE